MSTNNFKYENVLVVCPDFSFHHDSMLCDCEDKNEGGVCSREGEAEGFDEFYYNEYVTDVQVKLEKIGFESCDKYDSDRNYSGKIIAKYGLEDRTGMIKWLEVVIRSGYYDGLNIDYIIDGEFNEKHAKSLDTKFEAMIRKTEKILRSCGTEMLKVAQFSNGEAVYQVKK